MGAIMSKLLIVFLMPCNIFLYPPAAMGIEGTAITLRNAGFTYNVNIVKSTV